MTKGPDYGDHARVFCGGRSQAAHPPGTCRFETSEVEAIKEREQVTMRRSEKNWSAYFDSRSRGCLPGRRQPPFAKRDEIR